MKSTRFYQLKSTSRPKAICWFLGLLTYGLFCSLSVCRGQGTFFITFDGNPIQQPATAALVQQYYEEIVWFRPVGIEPGNGFVRSGGGNSFSPENSTAYLQAGLGSSLMFSLLDGRTFDLISVDIAEYSTLFPNPLTVHFIGYRSDGSIVTTDLTTDGVIDGTGPLADFQTFYFDSRFSNLSRVEIPTTGWSLDNLIITPVPEPGSAVLIVLGGSLLGILRWRNNLVE